MCVCGCVSLCGCVEQVTITSDLKRDIVVSVTDDEHLRVFEVYNDFCALEDDANMLTDSNTYVEVPPDRNGSIQSHLDTHARLSHTPLTHNE